MANLFSLFIKRFNALVEQEVPVPVMIAVVGHNGAGKSTCFREVLQSKVLQSKLPHDHLHIDPDAVEREISAVLKGSLPDALKLSLLAQEEANRLRHQYRDAENFFSFETVFSDEVGDKVAFLRESRERGYIVAMIAVGLDSPAISAERVARRVAKGGHDVGIDKIYSRYSRVLSNIAAGVKIASIAVVVDNSKVSTKKNGHSFRALAVYENGTLLDQIASPPNWWNTCQLLSVRV